MFIDILNASFTASVVVSTLFFFNFTKQSTQLTTSVSVIFVSGVFGRFSVADSFASLPRCFRNIDHSSEAKLLNYKRVEHSLDMTSFFSLCVCFSLCFLSTLKWNQLYFVRCIQ